MKVHACVMVSFKPDSQVDPKKSISVHDRQELARDQLLAFAKQHIPTVEQFSFKQVTEWLESGCIHFTGQDGLVVIGWIAEMEVEAPVAFRTGDWGRDSRQPDFPA